MCGRTLHRLNEYEDTFDIDGTVTNYQTLARLLI